MKNLFLILFTAGFFLVACNNHEHKIELLNESASLPPSFKFDSLNLKVMASFANKKAHTMSTLYANQLALNNAIKGEKDHTAGELLTLVTWKQKDDAHWFGGRIPGVVQSVEVVKTDSSAKGKSTVYSRYTGKNLVADADTSQREQRIKYILQQQPSVMP